MWNELVDITSADFQAYNKKVSDRAYERQSLKSDEKMDLAERDPA
jgi:hypothetical protein